MPKSIDLTGKRFGRLTVIKKSNKKRYGRLSWDCQCECGNYIVVATQSLNSGETKSCGCLSKEIAAKRLLKLKNDIEVEEKRKRICGIHDGTMECSLTNKPTKANKTGIRGVTISKSGKFIAKIRYKRKLYYLGTFDTLELAKFARKEAEKKIWGKDLE